MKRENFRRLQKQVSEFISRSDKLIIPCLVHYDYSFTFCVLTGYRYFMFSYVGILQQENVYL
jgi:hypothetical protein